MPWYNVSKHWRQINHKEDIMNSGNTQMIQLHINMDMLNKIVVALADQPYKVSAGVINELLNQANNQPENSNEQSNHD